MTSVLLGVLSSLIATAIVITTGWIRSAHPRWWLLGLLSRLTGVGLQGLYWQQKAAEQALTHDLAQARWVKVLAGRGNALTRDTFSPLWSGELRPDSIQVLLPDPETRADSWLEQRESELRRFDPGFTAGLLRDQVRTNIDYLTHVSRRNTDIELRHFNLPNTCRIIATDRAAYLTFYSRYRHGRHSPCLYARTPGLLYDIALQLFDSVWSGSSPATSPK